MVASVTIHRQRLNLKWTVAMTDEVARLARAKYTVPQIKTLMRPTVIATEIEIESLLREMGLPVRYHLRARA